MANPLLTVHTPRGAVSQIQGENGIELKIEWNPGFGPDWTKHLQTVQARFDNEVLRITTPYVPMDTGLLYKSAELASNIGDGELIWSTPYAAAQYYGTGDSRPYSSLSGGHWGDRMKADNLSHLARFARKMVSEK